MQRKMNEVLILGLNFANIFITIFLTQETEERDATKQKVDKKMETRA